MTRKLRKKQIANLIEIKHALPAIGVAARAPDAGRHAPSTIGTASS